MLKKCVVFLLLLLWAGFVQAQGSLGGTETICSNGADDEWKIYFDTQREFTQWCTTNHIAGLAWCALTFAGVDCEDPWCNNQSCDDGDDCTFGDHCSGGTCVPGVPKPCGETGDICTWRVCENGTCVTVNAINGIQCFDGSFCNGRDECSQGDCKNLGPEPCDASETCDEATKSCLPFNPDPTGSCQTAADCDDGNPCITRGCINGSCVMAFNPGSDDPYMTNGDPCADNGRFCDGVEECQGGACISTGNPCGFYIAGGEIVCENACNEELDECTVCPTGLDSDCDGICDSFDSIPFDGDEDDDGLLRGPIGSEDLNANGVVDPGETDPFNPDTDGDGLPDGLERGLIEPETDDTDLTAGFFWPDADPLRNTDPTNPDSDYDGLTDGEEDLDKNGKVDAGETNPMDRDSDNDGYLDGDEVAALTDPLDAGNVPPDEDMDLVSDWSDNCRYTPNFAQADDDGDGVGNLCDNCKKIANEDQADADEDGIGDLCDSCLLDPLNDADIDGICGDVDMCPDSDLYPVVVIQGCNSGAANYYIDEGCTISDGVSNCATGASNHDEFVECASHLTNALMNDGIISRKEKGKITRCAGKADIP